jgi:protein-arginine kinase activator protein McsA
MYCHKGYIPYFCTNGHVIGLSIILQNIEEKCRHIQTRIESLSTSSFSAENYETLHNKLQTIIASVSRSKKKIMVRTEKGKELSRNADTVTNELENTIEKIELDDNIEPSETIMALVTQLEKEVSKIETYWKMYEAAVT